MSSKQLFVGELSFEKIVLLPWNKTMSIERGKAALAELLLRLWRGGTLPCELPHVFISVAESPGVQRAQGREWAGLSGSPLIRRSRDGTLSSPHHIDKTLAVSRIEEVGGWERKSMCSFNRGCLWWAEVTRSSHVDPKTFDDLDTDSPVCTLCNVILFAFNLICPYPNSVFIA